MFFGGEENGEKEGFVNLFFNFRMWSEKMLRNEIEMKFNNMRDRGNCLENRFDIGDVFFDR